MSFLSGILGDKADSYVDQAVDTAAKVAKEKVKDMLSGDGKAKDETGGMGDLFPSSGDDDKKKESGGGGGMFGGLLSTEKDDGASGGDSKSSGDLTDMLGDVAGEIATDAAKDKAKNDVMSFGKSLFG